MIFLRQRVAGILLAVGLILAWIGMTTLVIRQTLLLSGQVPNYAATALENPTVRLAVSDLVVRSIQNSNQVLTQIPTAALQSAVDQALTSPAVAYEFGNVAQQIQLHFLGLEKQPVVIGGPALSSAVAAIVARKNPALDRIIQNIPFSYTVSSSSLPSIGRYYRWINNTMYTSLIASAVLLVGSLMIAAKKAKTLRKIGVWFLGFSVFEVAIFWLFPRYLLSHMHSGVGVLVAGLMTVSAGTIEPIYIGVFGAGLVLTLSSFLI